MRITVLPNKDLEVVLESDDAPEEVREWGIHWERMFEEAYGRGWTTVAPEWIGALTGAPIVTDEYTVDDAGKFEVLGEVWWFPNYAVEDPVETLAKRGRVVFRHAPKEPVR